MATLSSISVASFQTALIAVATALDAGTYRTAWLEYAKAEIALAGLPLTNQKEGLLVQLRSSLDAIKKAIETAEAKSAGRHFEKRSKHHP